MPKVLPTRAELRKQATVAKKRIKLLFNERIDLSLLEKKVAAQARLLGLRRIKEKCKLATLLARHMEERSIASIASLAELHYIGEDHIEALFWLRSPVGLRYARTPSRVQRTGLIRGHDDYLLALCDLSYDAVQKSYVPTKTN